MIRFKRDESYGSYPLLWISAGGLLQAKIFASCKNRYEHSSSLYKTGYFVADHTKCGASPFSDFTAPLPRQCRRQAPTRFTINFAAKCAAHLLPLQRPPDRVVYVRPRPSISLRQPFVSQYRL